MSARNVWTNDRAKARRNEYDGLCKACGKPVMKNEGHLVSTMSMAGTALANGGLHDDCPLPSDWYLRAGFGHSGMLQSEVRECPDVSAKLTGATAAQAILDELTKPEADEPTLPPTEAELKKAVQELLAETTDSFIKLVPPLVRDTMLEATRVVEIKIPKAPAVKIKNAHKALATVLMAVVAGTNPFLVGPAGSGKTTIARQVAETLKRKFYCENRVTSEFKLLGFMDAHGDYVRTQFRDAYEKGGVFLFDEVDASDPDALVALNSAIENGICPFADKLVTMHADFVCIAAGNTYGRGADRHYVGRNQLDASTLDRFVIIEIDYDEEAELSWAGDVDWTRYVQRVRKAVEVQKVRHIVSPRASIYGGRLLAAGMERKAVEDSVLWKGLDDAQRVRVVSSMGAAA